MSPAGKPSSRPHRLDNFYSRPEWHRMRAFVFRRDGGKCRLCGGVCASMKDGVVDHILRRTLRPDLAMEPTNLQWLCTRCHNSIKQTMERNEHKPLTDDNGYPPDWQ